MKDEGGGMRVNSRQDLRKRTRDFALRIIKLYAAWPKTTEAQVLGKQLLRSGTSVGAHYREACRAKSNADFISKIEGGLQELDETTYWLELLSESQIIAPNRLQPLEAEANELIAMFVAMAKGMKQHRAGSRDQKIIPHPSALIP
jgi:four helix bundle protein